MPTGDLYDYRLVHSMRYLKSPLFPVFRRLGATSFLWYNHILHAVDFEGQTKDQEYWAIRNGATLWDVGVERPVEIDGPGGFARLELRGGVFGVLPGQYELRGDGHAHPGAGEGNRPHPVQRELRQAH